MKVPLGDKTPDAEEMKVGEKIANNYKRSKAEQLAREAQENEGFGAMSMKSAMSSATKKSRFGGATSMSETKRTGKGENDVNKLISSKIKEVSQFEGVPPDPENVLGAIFFG